MPWQSAPPLVIITLAFGAIGGLMQGLNYVKYGRRDRKLRLDPFDARYCKLFLEQEKNITVVRVCQTLHC